MASTTFMRVEEVAEDADHPGVLCPGGEPQHFRQCEMGHPKTDAERHPQRTLPYLRLPLEG